MPLARVSFGFVVVVDDRTSKGRCFDHEVCSILPLETSEKPSFILFPQRKSDLCN